MNEEIKEIAQFDATLEKSLEDFMGSYKMIDVEQVYSNGTEFVPIFRVKQWLEYNNITNLQEKLKVSQTNEETYRLEMQDITKILGLDEHTTFDEVKEYATNLQEDVEDLRRIFGVWNNRKLIKKFNKEYDKEDKNKNPNRDYVVIYPDAEEVYKRYYDLKKENKKLKEIAEEHKNCTRKHWQQKCAKHCANEMIYKSRNEKAIEFIKEKISSTKGVINDYMYHKEHNKILIELLQEDIELYKKELNILNGGDK